MLHKLYKSKIVSKQLPYKLHVWQLVSRSNTKRSHICGRLFQNTCSTAQCRQLVSKYLLFKMFKAELCSQTAFILDVLGKFLQAASLSYTKGRLLPNNGFAKRLFGRLFQDNYNTNDFHCFIIQTINSCFRKWNWIF